MKVEAWQIAELNREEDAIRAVIEQELRLTKSERRDMQVNNKVTKLVTPLTAYECDMQLAMIRAMPASVMKTELTAALQDRRKLLLDNK